MMEFTKDDHIRRIDKRIDALEKRIDKNFNHLDSSFKMFIDVLEKLESKNKRLLTERDQLISDYNKLMKKMYPSKKETKTDYIEPVKSKIKDEFDFVRLIAKQTISETPSDKLYELVILNGSIGTKEASRRLNVREARVRKWASELEKKKLIDMQVDGDSINLVKI